MKNRCLLNACIVLTFSSPLLLSADDHENHSETDDVFEYHPGEKNWLTGEGVNVGGFLFPELYVLGTGGWLQPGTSASDLASAEHDPQNDIGIQAIELHIDVNINDVITGGVQGAGFQGEEEWEAEVEEAYLHYHLTDTIAVGGGQFLNKVGFQADQHAHDWFFVNQNLVNSRILNEGELVTQGGELLLDFPELDGMLTIGGGGARTHAHDHDHAHGEEEEDHDHDHEEEEDHHEEGEEHGHGLDADEANFNDWVFSADYKFRLPVDDSMKGSVSLVTGENGFGRQTYAYGLGFEKVWNGHDHGYGPEFCTNALMLRSEFVGREIEAMDAVGRKMDFEDYGFSTALLYGLSDNTTVGIRHDWVSDLDALGLEDRHRLSPVLTTFLDKNKRIQARLQYDYNHSASLPEEHAAWLQIQIAWGGEGGGHHHHH